MRIIFKVSAKRVLSDVIGVSRRQQEYKCIRAVVRKGFRE